MQVAVCCKGIPVGVKLESASVSDDRIVFESNDVYINEFDAYAIEAAVALKKTYGTDTFALSLGPLSVQEVLYFALAKGIDQAFRVEGESSRPELIACGLLSILKKMEPQLILVGAQSEDWGGGEVGIYLSQGLDMGLAYAVVEICKLDDTSVCIKKEIGGGRIAEVVLELPAVLCVQSGIQPLRYLSAVKRKKARKHPIESGGQLDLNNLEEYDISGLMAYKFEDVNLPSQKGHAEMITGKRSEKATKILEIIKKTI